jgi:hypothetical protein
VTRGTVGGRKGGDVSAARGFRKGRQQSNPMPNQRKVLFFRLEGIILNVEESVLGPMG